MSKNNNERVLIIGFGSIGQRHAEVLTLLGCKVAVVSSRANPTYLRFSDIKTALMEHKPSYVVISNRTSEHWDSVQALASLDYKGKVLVEKPLFDKVKPFPVNVFENIHVAYNLRFHPAVTALREAIRNETIISSTIYVGQYLPAWREKSTVKESYSSKKEFGGGALRDLSHELDTVLSFFGSWKKVSALGGHYSDLEIDSDDVFSLLFSTQRCPHVMLQMNYLDRLNQRFMIVQAQNETYKLDLIAKKLASSKGEKTFNVERNDTYLMQHKAVLSGDFENLCTVDQAQVVLNLIMAAEHASKTGKCVIHEQN